VCRLNNLVSNYRTQKKYKKTTNQEEAGTKNKRKKKQKYRSKSFKQIQN